MQRLFFVVIVTLVTIQFSHAQWTPSGSNVYFNTGNVGIGAETPSFALDILKSGTYQGIQLRQENGKWIKIFSPSLLGGSFNNITSPNDAGIVFGNIAGLNTVDHGFVITPHRSSTGGIRITPSGDVGIGVSDPRGYRLAVGGKAIAEEVVVKLQGNWPDYVFETGYSLPSLSELEKFILIHKHLPDVPSQKDVEANGLSVGEMNSILLKKVEELTLYIIEQNRTSERQQEEIAGLKLALETISKK